MSKVTVYAAGGTGVNIGRSLINAMLGKRTLTGSAEVNTVLLDSSDSNLRDVHNSDQQLPVYILEGLDGAGGDRAVVLAKATEAVPDILMRFQPSDLNIVVQSGGGGTGNVLGFVLTREMLKRGHNVVVMVVMDRDARKVVENSIKTFESYEKLVRIAPVVMAYYENAGLESEQHVNLQVLRDIGKLSVMWSGQNHGMDSKDLENFLHYDRVTSFEPALTRLHLDDDLKLDKGEIAVAMASLYSQTNQTPPLADIEYSTKGMVLDADAIGSDEFPIHFVLTQGTLSSKYQALKEREEHFKNLRGAIRPKAVSHVEAEDDEIVI